MQTLLHRRSLSRAELSETLGLSRATVAGLVHELELAGVVAQQPDENSEGRRGIGRPPLQVLLSPRAAFAIGLDLGHERVSAAMCDLAHGEVLVTRTAELPARREPRVVLELAERLTLEVLAEARVDISKVLGVGVGLAAPVGSASGEIYAAHILPGWNDVRPAELLERQARPPGPDRQRRQRRRDGRVPLRRGPRTPAGPVCAAFDGRRARPDPRRPPAPSASPASPGSSATCRSSPAG